MGADKDTIIAQLHRDLNARDEEIARLRKPAEQHQGQPVAMPARLPTHRINSNGWNACLDEIAKLGPLFTHPAPAVELDGPARNALEVLRRIIESKSAGVQYAAAVAACHQLKAALSASAEPSAPVECDERAAFDAAYDRGDFYFEEQRSEVKYKDYRRHQAWAVWQVRAALERKP